LWRMTAETVAALHSKALRLPGSSADSAETAAWLAPATYAWET
jgi:hypothetical protein